MPGQYLAIDPKGRAVMIGAVEKQKLVFIMNRLAKPRLVFNEPIPMSSYAPHEQGQGSGKACKITQISLNWISFTSESRELYDLLTQRTGASIE